jgi:hypothetical protein
VDACRPHGKALRLALRDEKPAAAATRSEREDNYEH